MVGFDLAEHLGSEKSGAISIRRNYIEMSTSHSKDNPSYRIDEELVSVDALKHVLCTRCGCTDIHIHREQRDPPDFTVTVDGVNFPTEVTSIVSQQEYHAQCEEFARTIQDRAISLGILSGKYAFIVSRLPCIPKPTSSNGRKILAAALAYINATNLQEASSEVQLIKDKMGKISIEKASSIGSIIGTVWIPPAMWEGEIHSQLITLIQQAVDNKKGKLQDVGIGPVRALLLLYDAFAYAEPKDALAAMQQVNGHDWYHSIFWAASFFNRKNTTYPEEPGRNGIFLFSNNSGWKNVGTIPFDTGV